MNTKENYKIMIEKVRNESTLEGLWRLEESNSNLYDNGCLQGFEFRQIDLLIMDKIAKIDGEKEAIDYYYQVQRKVGI